MPVSESHPIRVVLVDDHEMVAESFRRVLASQLDIEVIATVGTVASALDAVTALVPDVVLMDYLLPDGNGVTAARDILARFPDMKVILLTGSDAPAALPGAIEAGCAGYLEKTSALDALAGAVRAAAVGQIVLSVADLRTVASGQGVEALTRREREVLGLLAEGCGNKEIAARLGLRLNTVRNHVQNVLVKLGVHSKLEAVSAATRRGLVLPQTGRR